VQVILAIRCLFDVDERYSQLRIAKLETRKTRCGKLWEAVRLAVTIPRVRCQRIKIFGRIRLREAELRKIEDELHELYVQQIREES